MIKKLSIGLVLLLSACVYKLDIQQGNILAQKDIDKLRAGLTRSQVVFVLGTSVVEDSFSDDKWVYLYSYQNKNKGIKNTKKLTLVFNEDKLVSAAGDFDIPVDLTVK